MADRMDGVRGRREGRGTRSSVDPETGGQNAHAERLVAARRRAGAAKGIFGVAAALVFAAAAVFARHSFPGHPKGPAAPLGAPQRFVDVVRQDQLQGGVVAPPQAPPDATTGVS